jgi:glycosyltransferase involved in cell wall biosynthesis
MSEFALLLTTYNGAAHLPAQLDSLATQTVSGIDIWHSDDGSTDTTTAIVAKAAEGWGKGVFKSFEGPHTGFAENFRSLICNPEIAANYVAYCDQDDIWDRDKLEVAKRALDAVPAGTPALYGGRTRLIDENGNATGMSPLMRRRPEFRNALVQSIAGGNTMVMNRAAFDLLRRASREVTFVSHDWWSYLMVSGAGGTVIYDAEPHISYRQHGGNLVGANTGLAARLRRYRVLLSGRFAGWNEVNIEALKKNLDLLTPANAAMLREFDRARKAGPFSLLAAIYSQGLRRQSVLGDVSLCAGALLGKM